MGERPTKREIIARARRRDAQRAAEKGDFDGAVNAVNDAINVDAGIEGHLGEKRSKDKHSAWRIFRKFRRDER